MSIVLFLKEDDDSGYNYGVFSNVTNFELEHEVEYLWVDVSLNHVYVGSYS